MRLEGPVEASGIGGSMAADQPIQENKPNDEIIAVSADALRKAEEFVEAEEGATNRLQGWTGTDRRRRSRWR